MCFHSCRDQNQNSLLVSFVLHSCRTRVALVSHSCRSCRKKTIKFDQLIEYNMRKFFLKNVHEFWPRNYSQTFFWHFPPMELF